MFPDCWRIICSSSYQKLILGYIFPWLTFFFFLTLDPRVTCLENDNIFQSVALSCLSFFKILNFSNISSFHTYGFAPLFLCWFMICYLVVWPVSCLELSQAPPEGCRPCLSGPSSPCSLIDPLAGVLRTSWCCAVAHRGQRKRPSCETELQVPP